MLALYIIAGLVVLGAAVLAVPVDVRARLDIGGRPPFTAAVCWLFGLLRFNISSGKHRPRKKKKPKPVRKKRSGGLGWRSILDILLTKGLAKQFFFLVKRSFQQLGWRDLQLDMRIGLDDPADSGMLFAYIGPVTPFLPRRVTLRPVIGPTMLEGFLSGTLRIIPLLFLFIFLRFLFSLPVLRALGKTVRLWWRNRKRDRPRLDTAEPVPS